MTSGETVPHDRLLRSRAGRRRNRATAAVGGGACLPDLLRRWRIAEARRHGWTPLPRIAALALLDQMAEALASGRERADDQTRRGFYAALAIAPDDEADFAAAIAAARPGRRSS
jgi:hypothetical protein